MNRRHITMPAAGCTVALSGFLGGDKANCKTLFDARRLLEAAMARQAARTMDDSQRARLQDALEANRQAIGDRHLFMETDIEFHRILFQISGNPVFDSIHALVVNWLMKCWGEIERDEVSDHLAFQGHAKVLDALAQGDPDAAERAMNQHLSVSWSIWAGQLARN